RVERRFVRGRRYTHEAAASSYPASSTAAATAARSSSWSVSTRTGEVPPSTKSTLTVRTPSRAEISSVTAFTQCWQVMPETWYVVVMNAPWEMVVMRCGLRLHQASDRRAGFGHLGLGLVPAGFGGIDHAVR